MINQDVRIRVAVAAGAVVDDDGVGGGKDDVLYGIKKNHFEIKLIDKLNQPVEEEPFVE